MRSINSIAVVAHIHSRSDAVWGGPANGSHPQSWTAWLLVFGALAAIILFIWLIDRIFKLKQYKAAAGNALLQAEVFFNPSRQNVIEAKQKAEIEEDESGDPPDDAH